MAFDERNGRYRDCAGYRYLSCVSAPVYRGLNRGGSEGMTELFTRKGVYRPGEEISLCLRVENLRVDRAEIVIWRLSQQWNHISLPVIDATTEIILPPVAEDGACFGVEATLYVGGDAITTVATGVNIGGKVVRYGFLCDFSPEDGYDPTDVETLAAYHIDHDNLFSGYAPARSSLHWHARDFLPARHLGGVFFCQGHFRRCAGKNHAAYHES